jgi:hypothetical protein
MCFDPFSFWPVIAIRLDKLWHALACEPLALRSLGVAFDF